jgi:hypothetical protein
MEVLIITGQAGYHSWQLNYKALQDTYASHELFSPTVLISPAKGDDMGGFSPDFNAYDVIVLDYEGDEWPAQTRRNFEEYVKEGRGPAKHMDILATAYSDPATGGSGKHEPVMFTIQYHKGRVFHTVLGHMLEGSETAMYGKGFRTFLLRGTEWAATGNVTQAAITEF